MAFAAGKGEQNVNDGRSEWRHVPVTNIRHRNSRKGSRGIVAAAFRRKAVAVEQVSMPPASFRLKPEATNALGHVQPPLVTGRKHRNVAPPSALFSARIDPPWSLTIDRLIASPRPRPCSRNVTNGSNTRSS